MFLTSEVDSMKLSDRIINLLARWHIIKIYWEIYF